jgi:hypothetical protein
MCISQITFMIKPWTKGNMAELERSIWNVVVCTILFCHWLQQTKFRTNYHVWHRWWLIRREVTHEPTAWLPIVIGKCKTERQTAQVPTVGCSVAHAHWDILCASCCCSVSHWNIIMHFLCVYSRHCSKFVFPAVLKLEVAKVRFFFFNWCVPCPCIKGVIRFT